MLQLFSLPPPIVRRRQLLSLFGHGRPVAFQFYSQIRAIPFAHAAGRAQFGRPCGFALRIQCESLFRTKGHAYAAAFAPETINKHCHKKHPFALRCCDKIVIFPPAVHRSAGCQGTLHASSIICRTVWKNLLRPVAAPCTLHEEIKLCDYTFEIIQ